MMRRLLAGGVALATAAAAYAWHESTRVELSYTVVRLPDLPPDLDGLRILHISDTHFPANGASLPRFRRAAAAREYDLVLATGDYADTAAAWPVVVEAFRGLPPRLGIVVSLGAHDYYAPARGPRDALRQIPAKVTGRPRRFVDPAPLIAALEALGVRVLVNASTMLEIGGARLRIAGVDDAYIGRADAAQALGRPAGSPAPDLTILLSHSPDGLLDPAVEGVTLALCGHTHGGQIRVPGYGAPLRRARSMTRQRPAGRVKVGGVEAVVSRGFGTTTVPLRFACRPELGIVELRAASAPRNRDDRAAKADRRRS